MTDTTGPDPRAQYVRSTDPEVLRAIQARQEARNAFVAELRGWAAKHGIDPDTVMVLGSPWGLRFGGLSTVPSGLGRWTKPGKSGRSLPYRNNPVWYELASIEHDPPDIPGATDTFYAAGGDLSVWFMAVTPFVWQGAAWVCLPHRPTQGQFGPQWEEVRASEALRAREEWNA